MALEKEEEASQNAPFCVLDGLYCDEETGFVEEDEDLDDGDGSVESVSKFQSLPLLDMFLWDDDELMSLISKEKETNPCFGGDEILDGFWVSCRKEALDWFFRVNSHHGFTSSTAILAVNYFDRFMTTIKLQTDNNKPWMSQLVAVACLSLAAKVEEIHVPLLFDLQVEEARYVFEAKTIQRMELLVLSTLQWRMHPVTPISFFDHFIRRFGSECHQQLDFFGKCERLLISVVADTRFMSYVPSVIATAIMIYVIKDLKPCDEVEYQSQLLTLLKVDQNEVNECYELLLEHNPSKKRKMNWPDQDSPSGVFDFDDSSNGSWGVSTSSVSSSSSASSPESLLKRRKVQEQQMRLPSLNRMFLDVLSSSPR
ncbi:PREDICTED: cyclin-D3-2-like [Camelina sativa]|uniref:Cyclin-D3-2-like n=1 Tax=Camelina sativa TaxID=90675 RepID=A0ABM0W1A6_CAMSA|nr:PREDICTED: cyclin-D3-2-like [Camelina sativa]